jgi:hypothetical protein
MTSQTGRGGSSKGDGGPTEAASYLAEKIAELIQIAHIHRLDMLSYLLDMARMEAAEIARTPKGRGSQRK